MESPNPSRTVKAECIDRKGSVIVEVPVDQDGLPLEWIYLQDGQLAPSGRRFHRYPWAPVVAADPWEYFPG